MEKLECLNKLIIAEREIERLRLALNSIATGRKRILGYSIENAEEAAKLALAGCDRFPEASHKKYSPTTGET